MKIGFAGLGKMGSAMARNLLQAGHNIAVYNRTPGIAHALNSEGARVATSPAEAVRNADAVFTMLPDDKTESDVTFGENGISSGLASGAYHISCSTISAACARTLDEEHRNRRQGYLSAPVFGRPEAAQNKKLLVVAAGDSDAIERFAHSSTGNQRSRCPAGDAWKGIPIGSQMIGAPFSERRLMQIAVKLENSFLPK
jgi:3-hydroxyisobutyrate dehydrogenase-like beta-hydroxyacid dehydrogenase